MTKKMMFCIAVLLLAIIPGCGMGSGKTFTRPSEQEAAEFFEFFAKAINAGDYDKIIETIDPEAMYFFKPDIAESTRKINSNDSEIFELQKTEYEKQLRTIKSVSLEPEYDLTKEGVVGFSVDAILQNGRKLQLPVMIALYKNGKGKIGICLVHVFG